MVNSNYVVIASLQCAYDQLTMMMMMMIKMLTTTLSASSINDDQLQSCGFYSKTLVTGNSHRRPEQEHS
jgi:hypothetical protein